MKNQRDLYWLCGDFWEVIRQSLKTDKTQDAGILQQTTAVTVVLLLFQSVYLCFSLFSSFIMHTFTQYHFCQFEKSKRKRSLSVVFLLWLHCMNTIFHLPFIILYLSLSCIEMKEQGRAKCERTERSGERLEFIKNKWLLDDDLFNHSWALWAWSSEARGEEKVREIKGRSIKPRRLL